MVVARRKTRKTCLSTFLYKSPYVPPTHTSQPPFSAGGVAFSIFGLPAIIRIAALVTPHLDDDEGDVVVVARIDSQLQEFGGRRVTKNACS